MNRYLIKLTPLEFYFFGDENAFHFNEEGKQTSDSYYAKSLDLPPQSSILGMLRYVVLEQSGLLKSNGQYSKEELSEIEKCIGANGFDIENPVQLGKILNVSPLFIVDGEEKRYIKTPFNHKTSEKTYTPFDMDSELYETSHGKILLPKDGEFDPKNTLGLSFTRLEDLLIVNDITESDERVGIAKTKDSDGFVKKCYCKLKDGYSFAVVADFEDFELQDTVCYMGREKSSFKLEAKKVSEDFEPRVPVKDGFFYAWSDLVLKDKIEFSGFAVTDIGSVRILKSRYDDSGKLRKVRHEKYYSIIRAGSVFYGKPDGFYPDKYGYNKIIEFFGGKI